MRLEIEPASLQDDLQTTEDGKVSYVPRIRRGSTAIDAFRVKAVGLGGKEVEAIVRFHAKSGSFRVYAVEYEQEFVFDTEEGPNKPAPPIGPVGGPPGPDGPASPPDPPPNTVQIPTDNADHEEDPPE